MIKPGGPKKHRLRPGRPPSCTSVYVPSKRRFVRTRRHARPSVECDSVRFTFLGTRFRNDL